MSGGIDMGEPKNNNKKKKWIIISVIIVFLIITTLVCYYFVIYKNMKKIVKRDIIYEGISIEGIDIGGLSKQEALTKMKNIMDERILNKNIVVFYGDKKYTLPYSQVEYSSNYEEVISKAYNLFKIGGLRDRYSEIKKLKKNNIDYPLENKYNEEKIKEFISSIKNDFNIEPKNAIIHRKNSEFIIENEIVGLKLDITKNVNNLKNVLNNLEDDLELTVIKTTPKITKEYYSAIKDLLGQYSTVHNNNKQRTENLRIACKKINGSVIHPGNEFATHVAISPIDTVNGYKEAPIIIQGEVKDGIGGGVCQVATTLYNAVLYSELKIIQRQNHSMPVSYTEKGKDATMAGNHIDFIFKNSTNYPIYIESFLQSGKLYMKIYGKDERSHDRKIKFKSEIIEKLSPPKAKYIEDNALEEGKTKVKRKAINGYKVKLYKLIYVNGKLTDKKLVNTSYYRPVGAIIYIGKKPKETSHSNELDNKDSEKMQNTQNDEENTEEGVEEDEIGESTGNGTQKICI
jgi:vancomycin resistance protein YoaR